MPHLIFYLFTRTGMPLESVVIAAGTAGICLAELPGGWCIVETFTAETPGTQSRSSVALPVKWRAVALNLFFAQD